VNPKTNKEEEVDIFGKYEWKTYKDIYDLSEPL
jgi:hypothetical protein